MMPLIDHYYQTKDGKSSLYSLSGILYLANGIRAYYIVNFRKPNNLKKQNKKGKKKKTSYYTPAFR